MFRIFAITLLTLLMPIKLLSQKTWFMAKISCDENQVCEYILFDQYKQRVFTDTANGYFIWNDLIVGHKNGIHLIWNSYGKIKYADSLEDVMYQCEEVLGAKKNGKWGYYSMNGVLVIPHIYDDASAFNYGVALVKKNRKYYYIDKAGNVLKSVTKDIKKHYNEYGTMQFVVPVIVPELDHPDFTIFPTEPEFAKKGLISTVTGDTILEPIYDWIGANVADDVVVSKNNQYGIFNLSSRTFKLDCVYKDIFPIQHNW